MAGKPEETVSGEDSTGVEPVAGDGAPADDDAASPERANGLRRWRNIKAAAEF